jgi:predicted LPLAT superfamily acyltransferase
MSFCYRLFGERAARWLLYPVVAYFFLTGSKARTASLDYLRRAGVKNGVNGSPAGWRESFTHMLAFGQAGLDKLAARMGRIGDDRIDFPNRAEFRRVVASGRGAVMIGSHLGNLEMSPAIAKAEPLAIVNTVIYADHAQRFNETLARANRNFGPNLIPASNLGPGTVILLKERIDRGELLLIVGDRTPPVENARVSQVDFLGRPAPFAHGPFILASLLDCPVYLFFCLREGNRHILHFESFAGRIELPRGERQQRLQAYLQQYARRLEAYCLKTPYQWFNFYDFWQQETVGCQAKGLDTA